MSTYDPREMALDAIRGAKPPAHSGLQDFGSSEGVHALATALEDAVGTGSQEEEIERLSKKRDDLQEEVNDLRGDLKQAESDLKDANAKIGGAIGCLQ